MSLRFRAAAFLAGSLTIVLVSTFASIWGVSQADYYLDRTIKSDRQQDLLLLLSARVGDYTVAILDAIQGSRPDATRVQDAAEKANAVLDLLERSIEGQVQFLEDATEKNAEATEGLQIARMHALLRQLDRQIQSVLRDQASRDQSADRARANLSVFSVSFSPMLAQAVERERHEAAAAREDMGRLRRTLTLIAGSLAAGAIALAVSLVLFALRPVLRRTRETSRGMRALTQGALATRLPLTGRDELTLITAQFNRMAASFDRRQTRLTEGQTHLKETVAEKTADLQNANDLLNAIDANRRRFFTDISHELRTPLTVIRGEAEMTLRQAKDALTPEVRHSFETIAVRSLRLHRRLDDMLRVARSETGRIELSVEPLDLRQVLDAAIEDIAPLARQKEIAIAFCHADGTSECRGDKEWLRQVFGGLLGNAIKYSTIKGRIEVRCGTDDTRVYVRIDDEGCGVADGDIDRVFERFERGGAGIAHSQAGHGVGLALAKWIVAEHGGNILLESPGQLWKSKKTDKRGLTAIVSLPLPPRGGG